MERFLLATTETTDQATVTSNGGRDDAPASNLLRQHPGDWFLSDLITGLEITLDLGADAAAAGWSMVAPLYANFGSQCTWVVTAADTEAGLSSPAFATDPVPGQLAAYLDSPRYPWSHSMAWSEFSEWQGQGIRNERWVRVTVNSVDPKVPVGSQPFVRWGRVIVANPWQPSDSVEKGSQVASRDKPVVSRMVGGGERWSAPARKPRSVSYVAGFLQRAEALASADEVLAMVGESSPVLTAFNPLDREELPREMVYGRLGQVRRVHVDTNVYRMSFSVNESY